ncbi:hypothetical protein A7982_12116 [Minicystis rosea]|nr:hypothetical protein A7982_12116 [Minicystis rosea]
MASLSEYSNVYNTAFLVLKSKGFQVWFNSEDETYCAEKDGWDFKSDSPCGLLGLIAIYEFKHPTIYSEYWWKEEGEDIYGNLPVHPREFIPVWKKRD